MKKRSSKQRSGKRPVHYVSPWLMSKSVRRRTEVMQSRIWCTWHVSTRECRQSSAQDRKTRFSLRNIRSQDNATRES